MTSVDPLLPPNGDFFWNQGKQRLVQCAGRTSLAAGGLTTALTALFMWLTPTDTSSLGNEQPGAGTYSVREKDPMAAKRSVVGWGCTFLPFSMLFGLGAGALYAANFPKGSLHKIISLIGGNLVEQEPETVEGKRELYTRQLEGIMEEKEALADREAEVRSKLDALPPEVATEEEET